MHPQLDARKYSFAAATILLTAFLILLGPLDFFTHSNTATDLSEIADISQQEFGEDVLLAEGESFTVEFVPKRKHLSGFYLYLGMQQESAEGTIIFTICDSAGKALGADELLLNDLASSSWSLWRKIRIKTHFVPEEKYILYITNRDAPLPVRLPTLNNETHPAGETLSGNILLRYAYDEPTFTFQEKLLITLFVFSFWLLCLVVFIRKERKRKLVQRCAVLLLLILVLTWNGLFCTFDFSNKNTFDYFQLDSESLVTDTIKMHQTGENLLYRGFFLGRYEPPESQNQYFVTYRSQYGLQGRMFVFLSRFFGVGTLHLICAFFFAVTGMIIVCLIAQKYNRLLAATFYLTFLLSPWITNFARNLYWVEFTWFLPMVVGLFCAWKIDSVRCRYLCYTAAFLSLLGKSLCGYEYLSTVMIGLIQFLMVDILVALAQKEWKKSFVLIKSIFGLGIVAIAGFAIALAIHAYYRGAGSMIDGIVDIYKQDVLRRTLGGNPLNYREGNVASLDCSIWDSICSYFKFETQIITGVDGNLFPLLCTAPLVVFYCDIQKKSLDLQNFFLYFITFLGPLSWFVLAKAHSVVHMGMNFVLWYFGFIQICIYILVEKILEVLHRKEQGRSEFICSGQS